MTTPTSYLADQVASLQKQIADLNSQRVTFVQAPVTAVNTAGSTFTASVPNPADGTGTNLAGISSPPQFLPSTGQTVQLALSGPQVVYQPTQIAPGAITAANLNPAAPAAPTGLNLSTATAMAADGTTTGNITASWTAPTTTGGGGALTGTLTYSVQYRPTGTPSWYSQAATTTTSVLAVTAGVQYDVEVAAVDQLGNVGAYTAVSTILTGKDTTPPGAPSAPIVGNYLGQLKITWDGLLLGGGAVPPDFDHVEVHVSTASGFTPAPSTRVSDMSTGGSAYATSTYATTTYAVLVAVDHSGNKSVASPQGSGATSQVVSADIFAGAVGTSQLANLAVTTAKVNDLAVNNAKIGDVAVGKLTAGIMSADVTISGRFTTASSGARVEMNNLGFQKYLSDGSLAVSITGTDNYLYGTFKTATTGRRIEVGASGSTGILNFYSPSGQHCYLEAYTEPNAPHFESIQMSMDMGGHYLWNSVNIDNIPQIAYHSDWHEFGMTYSGKFQIGQYTNNTDFTVGLFYRVILDQYGWTYARSTDGATVFDIKSNNSNRIRFAPDGVNTGSVEVGLKVDNGQSPRLYFYEGSSFNGTMLKSVTQHLEVRDTGDTVCEPIFASAFNVASDEEGKTNIKDAVIDGAALTRGLRIRQYQRKTGPNPTDIGPVETGLIAQEAPPQILGGTTGDGMSTVNIYAYTTVLAAGLQASLVALDAVTARVAVLEGKVK